MVDNDMRYRTIDQLIMLIDQPYQNSCRRILDDNNRLFCKVQGSTNNHQAWVGGYFDHVHEIMNIAVVLYESLNSRRPLPFSLSDLLLVVYLHDIEKPWKYELRADGELHHRQGMETKEDHQNFRMQKLAEYGIELTSEHENGLKYAEGEIHDYSNRERKMGPLACVAHMCDVASARLWFDHPAEKDDPWMGAARVHLGKCLCGQNGTPDHTCPFAEEINNDFESMCNCCSGCRYDCAQDV
jgi:23S rRNA maturation-related 3'-5' exoribonuclease YhaM